MRPALSIFLPQTGLSYSLLRQRARCVEALGYDALWVVDHMWTRALPDVAMLDGWTTIAGLAEATVRLRLGVLVTCNSYRNPGMLAKAVVTADHISEGRIEFGIGAGWMEEEFRAYGFDFPSTRVRLAQLEESLTILTRLFGERRTSFQGDHYEFRDAPFEPKPVQSPFPITLGGSGTRLFMRLVARFAARWNCPMPAVPALEEHLAALARHCENVGRDPDDIVVSEQTCIVLGRSDADYREKLSLARTLVGSWVDLETMAVHGTPPKVADTLRAKMARGVRDFAIVFGDLGPPETLELFMSEVAPLLG
jgi:F420-dependent oxidoreductase-like protein